MKKRSGEDEEKISRKRRGGRKLNRKKTNRGLTRKEDKERKNRRKD
jgi:hypothetical protein